MPKNAVYVGRRSKWANRYEVVAWSAPGHGRWWTVEHYGRECTRHLSRKAAQGMAVACWRKYQWPLQREAARRELAGKHLACWCRIGDPCHGDIMLKEING